MFDSLVRKYEAGGDPGCVSSGRGDLGGVSYGIYQLSSAEGSAYEFADWASRNENLTYALYGAELAQYDASSQEFQDIWKHIGDKDPDGFAELQGLFAKERYYDPAVKLLKGADYDVETKSNAMKSVLFSRAIQYGASNMVELYTEAVHCMYNNETNDYTGWPNLSYVDDKRFDYDMIAAIYDFLIQECDDAEYNGSYMHSPKDWCNGSAAVIYGLRNRFAHEKEDALELLQE